MRFFTADAVVIGHGRDYLGIAAITLAAYPILFVTVFMLQGMKRPAYGLWMGLYRQIAAPMLLFHLLAFTFAGGTWGVWWGISLVNWSAAVFALWWGARILRRELTSSLH
jgi:Na+-driven multidrug efflux pump